MRPSDARMERMMLRKGSTLNRITQRQLRHQHRELLLLHDPVRHRCLVRNVLWIAQHCSFSATPLLPNERKRHARVARATLAFIWPWPPVELLREEGTTDCFLAAFAPSFLYGRRLEEFPRRCEANGRENQGAFRIRSKSRRGSEPRCVQRCRR